MPTTPRQPKTRSRTDSASVITSLKEYSDDEFEFLKAVEAWKKRTKRPFPSCTECLAIARSLGYRKEGGA